MSAKSLLTRYEMLELVRLSYTAVWEKMRDKEFPLPLELSKRTGIRSKIMWRTDEVMAWLAARPRRLPKGMRAQSEAAELAELVLQLEARQAGS